jgi:hypothetical protein
MSVDRVREAWRSLERSMRAFHRWTGVVPGKPVRAYLREEWPLDPREFLALAGIFDEMRTYSPQGHRRNRTT